MATVTPNTHVITPEIPAVPAVTKTTYTLDLDQDEIDAIFGVFLIVDNHGPFSMEAKAVNRLVCSTMNHAGQEADRYSVALRPIFDYYAR